MKKNPAAEVPPAPKRRPRKPKAAPPADEGELLPHYDFDYSKAKPNPFTAGVPAGAVWVPLDPDVAEVYDSPEAVNGVLRAIIASVRRAAG